LTIAMFNLRFSVVVHPPDTHDIRGQAMSLYLLIT